MANKPRILLTAIIVITLAFCIFILIPSVNALAPTIEEKGQTVLSNVVGLNLPAYAVTSQTSSVDISDPYLATIPQDNVIYSLNSAGSTLKILCTFANDNLQMIHVLDTQGAPSLTKALTPNNAISCAKNFLSNWQTFTSNPLYGQLQSTLNNVNDGKNLTKTTGNTVLEVTAVNDTTTFKWYYTANGAIAPYSKAIALGVKNGFLTAFVDDWQFFNVGSTTVNLSKEQATSIALSSVKAYAYTKDLSANGFKAENVNESNIRWVSLVFDGSVNANNARSSDPLELYPVWSVGVALDQWYGQLYGLQVDVWADTGEVRVVQEAWSTLPAPEGAPSANISTGTLTAASNINSTNLLTNYSSLPTTELTYSIISISIMFSSIIAGSIVIAKVLAMKKKNPKLSIRPHFMKTGVLLLCFLLLATIFLYSAKIVRADTQTGGAVVWGSESLGAYDYGYLPPNNNWRKSYDERNLQGILSMNISQNDLAYAGYDTYNEQGGASTKSNILATLDYFQGRCYPIAVVDFDHGMGRTEYAYGEFHFMFEDEVGNAIGTHDSFYWNIQNAVYDMDIFPRVDPGQVLFAFINACGSANLTNLITAESWQGPGTYGARGMPYAWTHRTVGYIFTPGFNLQNNMSDNGYLRPDGGHQVYIGFPYGSASLNQTMPYGTGSGPQYYRWVQDFFYAATHGDMSVYAALNQASWSIFFTDFGSCPLSTGFTPSWWNMPGDFPDDCVMAVYGDANVHLQLRTLTVNAYDSSSNPISENVYIDGHLRGTTGNSFEVDSGSHTISVSENSNLFHYFTGYSEFSDTITVSVTQDRTLTANYYSNPPPQYTLSISSTEGGTTRSPYSPGNYLLTPRMVTVTADPDSGCALDYWVLDSQSPIYPPYSSHPTMTIPITANHNLQAVFCTPDHCFVSDINSYDGPVSDTTNMLGFRNDGLYATIEGWGPYENYGSITGTMFTTDEGHIYAYGYGYDNGPLYVYVSNDGVNWELIGTPTVPDTLGWIDCGIYNHPFSYIKFTAEYPDCIYNVYLDSVYVQPVYYQTLSISTDGEGYTNPSGNPVYERNSYAGVTACAAPTWVFDYWTLDGDYAGSDPTIYVYMDYDYNLEAHFSEASSLQYLTVNTYDAYLGYPYSPNVWVDGYWIGTGQQTLQVASGRVHTVSVDYTVYSEYWGCDANFYDFTGDVYYYPGYGPAYIYPTSSTTINALYLPYWWT